MKITVFFSLILVLASCSQNVPRKTEEGFQPVVAITATPNGELEKESFPASAVINTGDPWVLIGKINKKQVPVQQVSDPQDLFTLPTPEIRNDEKPFFKELVQRESKKFQVSNLEKTPISEDDIEIRVWRFSSLFAWEYKDSLVTENAFILKRRNGSWSADVFRNTVKKNSKVERRIRARLDVPKSGWENIWQNLIDNELLTFPDSVDGEVEIVPDGEICVIESKVNGVFKSFQNAGSGEKREQRYVAKILSIIGEEFSLEDFPNKLSDEQ